MNGNRGHLDILLEICHARSIPLLTAICVNQAGLETGDLGDDALRGFVSGAKRLGYSVTDEKAFLRDRQRECFEWAKSHPPRGNPIEGSAGEHDPGQLSGPTVNIGSPTDN